MTDPSMTDSVTTGCPTCGSAVSGAASFCENCGSRLQPSAAPTPASAASNGGEEAPVELSQAASRPVAADATPVAVRACASCGGAVGADGYCETCGAPAPKERDHYTEQPAAWVAACSDRGVKHHRNEDATAVAADPEPGSRAVLVVCDGVSTSEDSDVASLAAARAARDVLVDSRPAGLGLEVSRVAALESAMVAAVAAANTTVVAQTTRASANPASCTFSAVVVEDDLLVFGNVGDSRSYWIPDLGSADQPRQLSVDDSVAQLRVEMGVERAAAEAGPQAHAITKWLGRDSEDPTPTTGALTVAAPGWVLVCSDGLWNYCSPAEELQALVISVAAGGVDPLPVCEALVRWANDQGGKDNISVALARFQP